MPHRASCHVLCHAWCPNSGSSPSYLMTDLPLVMQDDIAELRRQLEEERQAREEAERRQEEAEQRLQPNSLFRLLDRCHESLSQAIRVETNATLTTQGNVTDPVNRLFPKRIVPWLNFPRIQEQIWTKLERVALPHVRSFLPIHS